MRCERLPQITRLLAVDGAQGVTRELLSRSLPATAAGTAELGTAAAVISAALGFDKCSVGTVSQMQSWWTHGPFRDANVYIGGVARGCAQPSLGASWVSAVFEQGWRLIPTWVGPQAPCTGFGSRISLNAATARNQGLAEADGAVSAAAALGFGPGSPIYYDLEAYSGGGACSAAVRAFVDAWTERLHARGYLAGAYGLPRNAQADWRSGVIAQPPDAVWLAYYACTGSSCAWTPRVLDIPGLDNAFWPSDQRIVQYWNSHSETWGGVTFTIDRNLAQGPVAAPKPALPDVVVESVSVSPASAVAGQTTTFAAVVRNVGVAATPALVSVGVGYRIDGTQVSWGFAPGPLAPGASVTIGMQGGPWIASPGPRTLTASVDDVNRFPESDEANNELSVSFVVADPCLESVPTERWKGEYFANAAFAGSPVLVKDHGEALALDWGAGSPGAQCGVPADAFSSRFTRTVDLAPGRYRFSVTADDGVRLRVDSMLVLDEWRDQVASFTADVTLSTGPHTLSVEHYENLGGARIELRYRLLEPVIVDDGDPGMQLLETATGRKEWWHRETGLGYGGDMVWTSNTLARKDNYARWTPVLPAPGRYQVEAFVPRNHASTTNASYTIVAAGQARTRVLNQAPLYDAWADLGSYDFSAGGGEYVELGDVTREPSNSKHVAFDAIRFTPVAGGPAPADTAWAFPVGSADAGAGWRVSLGLGQSWVASGGTAYNGHLAEDWFRVGGASLGQPVYAAADGEVVTVVQNCGNYVDVVVVRHETPGSGEPIYSMYGHIETTLRLGDRVRRRDPLGVLGDPVTFSPHLHFEVKNHTALVNPPLSSCANVAQQVYVSAGYSGRSNDYAGGDFYDPTDAVVGNRYYHPTRFILQRLAAGAAALVRPVAAAEPLEGDGLPRCAHPE